MSAEEWPLRCTPEPWEGEEGWALTPSGEIRCRPVRASEAVNIASLPISPDDIAEMVDEALHEGAVGEAWGNYGEPIVSAREGAAEALAKWMDEWLEVRVYVNEPEPGEAGR